MCLQYMPRNDSGYVDCYVLRSGQEYWVNRIQTASPIGFPGVFAGAVNQVPSVIVCVTSNYPDATHVRFKPQKGTFFVYGLGLTDQQRDVYANTGLHSDMITGARLRYQMMR